MEQRGDLCYKDILTDRLLAGLRQAARSRTSQAPSLLRLEVDVEGLAPADWLAARRRPVKTYWANRDGDFEAAGAGLADVLTDQTGLSPADALTEIRRRTRCRRRPRSLLRRHLLRSGRPARPMAWSSAAFASLFPRSKSAASAATPHWPSTSAAPPTPRSTPCRKKSSAS